MKTPFNDLKIKFGIHKGKQLKDVPDDYLKFLLSKNILRGKALFHCQVRFNLPKSTFSVTVEDAAVGDGVYTVLAYNKHQAISVCIKEYKIQGTQSYHGTTYSAELIN